jgi:hypothetical protein
MSCDIHVINAEVIVGIVQDIALESVLKRLKTNPK